MSEPENKGKRGGGFFRGGGRGRGNYRQGGYRGGYHGNKPFNKRPQMNNYHNQKRTKFEVTTRLKEVDIGITEFVGTHEHFTGIVKERFNDFHVHEINCDGEMSKLTNQDIPPEPALNLDELKKNLPQETLEQIESLSKTDADVNSVEIDVTEMNKEQRKALHTIGKQIPSIISQTVEKDQKKVLVLAKSQKKNHGGYRFQRDNRIDWSSRDGNFCHFVLHKVNMDTMDALNQMAMYLYLKPNAFSYAGTKDRRARTTQWVCLRQVTPSKILEAGKRIRGAYVGNFKFAKKPLKLGQLNGNHFTIALRNVTATNEEIEAAMISLRDKGFINYYGLQRFGTVPTVPTHEIGKALLQGNWTEAIDMILKPRGGELLDMAEAREVYANTKDAAAALKKLHRHDKIEAKLLKGLVTAGKTNPQGALDALPRNVRTMYIHAYQSFVWNYLASRRIKEFGDKPIVGDLVYEKPDVKEEVDENLEESSQNEDEEVTVKDKVESEDNDDKTESEEIEKVGEVKETQEVAKEVQDEVKEAPEEAKDAEVKESTAASSEDKKDDEKMETERIPDTAEKEKKPEDKKVTADDPIERDYYPLPAVKILTAEDLPNYTLSDIVMPQPGWRVTYPPYAKEWYDEFMAKDGLTTDLRQKNKKYSLGGQYRKILQIPQNLSWKIKHYNDIHADLVLADIDEMRNIEQPKDESEGKYKALILEMTLPSSTYATMALREVLKHDTSADTQAAQSAAHHAQDMADQKAEQKAQTVEEKGDQQEEDKMEVNSDTTDDAKKDEKMDVPDEVDENTETRAEPTETPNESDKKE